MLLTPVDIINKQFNKALRGYTPKDVNKFLEIVSKDYEQMFKENYELKEQIEKANQVVNQYKQIESTLHNTLVLAQQTSEEVKQNSKREAELILREARASAEALLTEARKKVDQMLFEYQEINRKYEASRTQFRTFLLTHLQITESQEQGQAKIKVV
jgi:cell division initiation protein